MEPFSIGKSYYVRFSFQGRQFRFSLKTNNKKVAQEIADQIERGLERGVFDSFEKGADGERLVQLLISRPGLRPEDALGEIRSSGRKLFKQAIEEYLETCRTEHSPANYRNEKRVFSDFVLKINVAHVHQVTPEAVEKWRNTRFEKVSKSTVNRELKMIKRFFRQAVDKGYLQKSPVEKLKTYREAEKAIRHLSDEEVRKLLEASSNDLKGILIFLLLTGLRYGELCHLNWSDIDSRRKQIIVQPKEDWQTKNLRKRVVPMHPTVEKILKELDSKKNKYVFPNQEGTCAEQTLRNRIYDAFKKARIQGNVKSLRSTFASNCVMSGMPIYTVAKLLGHHDVKITERHYAHLAPDYMGGAIKMLQPKWEKEDK